MTKFSKTLIASLLAGATCQAAAVESYDVIDLGTLNDNAVWTYDINNNGTSVGYSYVTFNLGGSISESIVHGFANQNGNMVDLGAISNTTTDLSAAFGVNEVDVAAGFSLETLTLQDESGNDINVDIERATYTDIATGTINTIPDFVTDEPQNMRAIDISDSGIVVGLGLFNPEEDTDTDGNPFDFFLDRGFAYDSVNDVLIRIDPIDGNSDPLRTSARDVNASGIVVGWSQKLVDQILRTKSFYIDIADPGNIVELPIVEGNRSSLPWAINDAGIIAGKRNIGTAFYYSSYIYDTTTQTLTDLGELREGYIPQQSFDISIAFDINNQDQVVGKGLVDVRPNISNVPADVYHAFIYEESELKDLNNLIDCKVDPAEDAIGEPDWVLSEARAINDNGVIVGNGIFQSQRKAFMLVPRPGVPPRLCENNTSTPEEDSGSGSLPLWMMAGLVGIVGLRRRQSR